MHKIALLRKLPGPDNLRARELYRLLEKHYHQAACQHCAFYKQYGVMIARGEYADHIQDIGGDWQAMAELPKLVKAKLIEVDEISTHQYRVTFVHIQAEKTKAIA